MTGQLVVARPVALSPEARRYPLATRRGVELLAAMIAAGSHWRPLTRTQRAALRRAYRSALAAIPRDAPDGTPVALPLLPADVHAATRRSLERRGLSADGRLTTLGVEVVQLADRDRRPVTTATPNGSLL